MTPTKGSVITYQSGGQRHIVESVLGRARAECGARIANPRVVAEPEKLHEEFWTHPNRCEGCAFSAKRTT